MATNPNVLKDRELYIGGSEIATILGINPFKTRYDLLLEKAGIKEDIFEGNSYTEFGDKFEPIIRNYINETYNHNFVEDTRIIDSDIINYRCNYDGLEKEGNLEVKTTSNVHNNAREYKRYVAQLLWGMILDNLKKGTLAVYKRDSFEEEFDPNKLQIFDINRNDYQDWENEINEEVCQFKIDLQKVKENPLITEEELLPTDINEMSSALIRIEEELKFYDEMVQRRDNLKERLRNIMIENGIKSIPAGTLKITNVLDKEDKEVQKFNEKQFKEENEELYNKYLETKIQKGRKGYLKITNSENEEN